MVSHFPNCGGLKIGSNIKQGFLLSDATSKILTRFSPLIFKGWKSCLDNIANNVEKSFKDQYQLCVFLNHFIVNRKFTKFLKLTKNANKQKNFIESFGFSSSESFDCFFDLFDQTFNFFFIYQSKTDIKIYIINESKGKKLKMVKQHVI